MSPSWEPNLAPPFQNHFKTPRATSAKACRKYAQDEPDEKAFDFEQVARAGCKDIVPRLVLVGFEDIDNYVFIYSA